MLCNNSAHTTNVAHYLVRKTTVRLLRYHYYGSEHPSWCFPLLVEDKLQQEDWLSILIFCNCLAPPPVDRWNLLLIPSDTVKDRAVEVGWIEMDKDCKMRELQVFKARDSQSVVQGPLGVRKLPLRGVQD